MPDEDNDYDPLESLMDTPPFDAHKWSSTTEQQNDIGRDVSERDEHPLGDPTGGVDGLDSNEMDHDS